jgi:hypothetical protein
MAKSREQAVRVECMGGCGKHQMIRHKIDRSWTFYGCEKCDGWKSALKAWRSRVPHGARVECGHSDVGGLMRLSAAQYNTGRRSVVRSRHS